MLMWTDESIDRAISMRGDGLSSARIADALGMTRNAVVGKLWRMGVTASGNVIPFKSGKPRATKSQWDESRMTERWADRKARLARERAA